MAPETTPTLPLRERTRLLVTYLRPQAGRVLLLGLLLGGSIGMQLANPQIIRRFIDSATQNASNHTLAVTAGWFLGFALASQLLSVVSTYLSENIGWTATNALRADVLLHCLKLDPAFHKIHTPGELIDRIDGDITTLANFFSQLIVQVIGNLVLLLGILGLLFIVDWRVGLLMTGLSVSVLFTIHRIQKWVTPRWKTARQCSAELYGFIEERLTGSDDIRSCGAQPYTMRRLFDLLRAQLRAEWSARLVGRSVWLTSDFLFTLGNAGLSLLGALLFRSHVMSIGTVYSLFFYVNLLWQPLTQITRQAEDFQKASAGIARINGLLGTSSAIKEMEASVGRTLPHEALEVVFDNVRFAYDGDSEPVLDGVTFRLAPGRILGVLGRTGSGKTTLTRLLFRLYDPQSGAIILNGTDIRDLPLAALRRGVGIVTQEVQLFSATLRDNLTLFDETIPDAAITDALHSLGLADWLAKLPNGLDTRIGGPNGLSSGEAQLLAFTRIFLRDPGVVVLDEASSRLDPATEQLIERAVNNLLVNRTGIIIAHRLHTVQRADAILILEGGQIAEYGERQILARDPESRFARLLQTGLENTLTPNPSPYEGEGSDIRYPHSDRGEEQDALTTRSSLSQGEAELFLPSPSEGEGATAQVEELLA